MGGGHSRQGEIIYFLNFDNCHFANWDLAEFQKFYMFMCNKCFTLYPYQKRVALIDLTHANYQHWKLNHIKSIFQIGYNNFCQTTNYFIVYNPNKLVRGIWKVLKHFLKKETLDELKVVESKEELNKLISEENRLKIHGGLL